MLKKMSILLAAVLLMTMVSLPVFAENEAVSGAVTGIVIGAEVIKGSGTSNIEQTVDKAMGTAITIAQSIGIAVAVILLIVVAIKYMAAAPSDKAEIKKHMVVYVVGAVLLLSAAGVLQLIKSLGDEIFNETTTVNSLRDGLIK